MSPERWSPSKPESRERFDQINLVERINPIALETKLNRRQIDFLDTLNQYEQYVSRYGHSTAVLGQRLGESYLRHHQGNLLSGFKNDGGQAYADRIAEIKRDHRALELSAPNPVEGRILVSGVLAAFSAGEGLVRALGQFSPEERTRLYFSLPNEDLTNGLDYVLHFPQSEVSFGLQVKAVPYKEEEGNVRRMIYPITSKSELHTTVSDQILGIDLDRDAEFATEIALDAQVKALNSMEKQLEYSHRFPNFVPCLMLVASAKSGGSHTGEIDGSPDKFMIAELKSEIRQLYSQRQFLVSRLRQYPKAA